jgi:bifunctional DNase/RNase
MVREGEEIRMVVKGLMLDPGSNAPIVILREEGSELFLPIWIGVFEASAIQLSLEGVSAQRPMTHDLLASTFRTMGVQVEKVVIHDLLENTFFATIFARRGDDTWQIDSRPSDALALALRVDAAIFVHERVLRKAHSEGSPQGGGSDEEKLRKWFEELDPDDLGKYTM